MKFAKLFEAAIKRIKNTRISAKTAQKIAAYLMVLLSAALIVWLCTLPDNEGLQPKQLKQFLIIFIALMVVLIAVLVMVRNAVLVNTLFLLRFKDQLANNGRTMDSLEKSIKENSGILSKQVDKTLKVFSNNLAATHPEIVKLKDAITINTERLNNAAKK